VSLNHQPTFLSEGAPPPGSLVLSETKLAGDILQRREDCSAYQFATVSQFLSWHFRSLKLGKVLDELESSFLIAEIISSREEEFPSLAKHLSEDGSRVWGVSKSLSTLKRSFNGLRLSLEKDRLIKRAIEELDRDKTSFVEPSELLGVFDCLEAVYEASGYFDRVGVLSRLNQLPLNELKEFREQWPELVLNEAYPATALEEELWLKYFSKSQISSGAGLESYDPLSRKRGQSSKLFENASEPSNENNWQLFQAVAEFDLSKGSFEGHDVELNKFASLRDEVRWVLSDISSLLDSGEKLSDFNIFTSDLELYRKALCAEASLLGIDLSIPKGVEIGSTEVGRCLFRLEKIFAEPNLEALNGLYHSSLLQPPIVSAKEFELLVPEEVLPVLRSLISKLDDEGLDEQIFSIQHDSYAHLWRTLKTASLYPNSLSSLEEMLRRYDQFLALEGADARNRKPEHIEDARVFVSQCLCFFKDLYQIEEKSVSAESKLRKFVEDRKTPIRNICVEESRQELSAWRKTLHLLRRLRFPEALGSTETKGEKTDPGREQTLWLVRLLRESSEKIAIAWDESQGLVCSELLDVRGLRNQKAYLLGLSSESFDVDGSTSSGTELEIISESLSSNDSVQENQFLVARLFHAAKSLRISWPSSHAGQGRAPAGIVEQLRYFLPLNDWPTGSQVYSYQDAPLTESSLARVQLIKSRQGAGFDSYEGRVGKSVEVSKTLEKEKLLENEVSRYSPSELELLADCPHRFFFKRLLRLENANHFLEFSLARETGALVHEVLNRYFDKKSVNEESFERRCNRMLFLAQEFFSKSLFDWETNIVSHYQKKKIIEGLETPDDSGKRGILKGFLVFQDSLIKTNPIYRELSFGRKGDRLPPMSIGLVGEGEILIRGIVDLVDQDSNGDWFVFDYKTGRATGCSEVEKGRRLQLPLYAAFLFENVLKERLPKRAALVSLSKPNRRDEGLSNINSGILVENLAFKKARAYLLDADAVAARFEFVRERVIDLDALVRAGNFTQIASTESCRICDYSTICSRNEAKLVSLEESEAGDEPDLGKADGLDLVNSSPPAPKLMPALSVEASRFSDKQRQAIQPEKDIVLKAGAGVGKTHVLVGRVLSLILAGAKPEEIVAITFTEKAAGEISTRVRRLLNESLLSGSFDGKTLDEEQRGRLVSAKEDLANASIGTIHSFCSQIIRAARRKYFAAVLDEAKREEFMRSAFQELISDSKNAESFSRLFEYGFELKTLERELQKLSKEPHILRALK